MGASHSCCRHPRPRPAHDPAPLVEMDSLPRPVYVPAPLEEPVSIVDLSIVPDGTLGDECV